jgi:hypothetical protein
MKHFPAFAFLTKYKNKTYDSIQYNMKTVQI